MTVEVIGPGAWQNGIHLSCRIPALTGMGLINDDSKPRISHIIYGLKYMRKGLHRGDDDLFNCSVLDSPPLLVMASRTLRSVTTTMESNNGFVLLLSGSLTE